MRDVGGNWGNGERDRGDTVDKFVRTMECRVMEEEGLINPVSLKMKLS